MSRKIVEQLCAICEREKKPSPVAPETPLDLGSLGVGREITIKPHKYGHLPAKKTDDFVQVTEPQWLRRGNLKESDLVCKRHLAILMKGVDRGCEGGCSSPLHRGARLCRPRSLKAIPPTWRKRFMRHPKIKDEDKEIMMFCWDCYKKHMNRLSKHGDPVGRPTANGQSIQRSQSVADPDENGTSSLDAMKKCKSMDKLDSITYSLATTTHRRASSSSSSPRYNGDLARSSKTSDADVRPTPSRRMNRGRRSHKGKRSPSPPNNISPVRTSVVHSKRKHSPHKYSKSPSGWRCETSSMESSPRNPPRLSVDEGALADTESPRAPPIPPPGLFSFKPESNDEVFDVFSTRSLGQQQSPKIDGSNGKSGYTSDNTTNSQEDNEPSTTNHKAVGTAKYEEYIKENGIHEEGGEEARETVLDVPAPADTPIQSEECTSADEMAAIFANQHIDNEFANEANNEAELRVMETGTEAVLTIPEFSDLSDISDNIIVPSHQHETSSGSSSGKTGETQIEREEYTTSEQVSVHDDKTLRGNVDETDGISADQLVGGDETCVDSERQDIADTQPDITIDCVAEQKTTVSTADFADSSFLSPVRQRQSDQSPIPPPSINYSLSPRSFRRLESLRLQFHEDLSSIEGVERHNFKFDDDVREKSHPMRNHVVFKLPRERDGTLPYSYIRLPAEDVEIFPDTISFLEGVTQTMGDEMAMYAQEGVRIVAADLKRAENKNAHRTSQFSEDFLIVRRGQPFEILLQLSEKYDDHKHKIMAELMIGDFPRVSNGTHLFIPIQPDGATASSTIGSQPESQWSGRIINTDEHRLTVLLTSTSVCPIGSYRVYFQVDKDGTRTRWQAGSEYDRKIIVIFNTWNIDDAVFMSSQADRQEYVVSDAGNIYSGSQPNFLRMPWIYGQYEPRVLQACIDLVECSGLSSTARGDPVSVAKAICKRLAELIMIQPRTSLTNAVDRPGRSGADILRRLFDTGVLITPGNNKAFAALLVTVFRCIGLPARPVTCTNCALVTDLPMNVNVHYSHEGHMLDHMNTDRIWPSYTWAGIWMSRVDLPPGFGGWQALLPQENGEGYVGPIPAYGIKKGQTSCCEGTKEHFIALNAHKKYWIVSEDGNMRIIAADHGVTGTSLVTKAVGTLEHQDITKLYKFSEGCEEQKVAIHTVGMHYGGQNSYDESYQQKHITVSLSTNPSVIGLGNDVDAITKVKNDSDTVRHLTITLDVVVLNEDGTPEMKVQRETILAEVLPSESVEIPVKLNLAPCLHKVTPYRHLSITAFGFIRETETNVIASHLVGIKYPEIEMQMHGEFKVGGEVTILSKLRNPLPYPLTNAKVSLSTSGLTPLEITTSNFGKSVGPWQVCKSERVYRCQRSGKHTVVATFSSDHLNGPVGMQEIEIT